MSASWRAACLVVALRAPPRGKWRGDAHLRALHLWLMSDASGGDICGQKKQRALISSFPKYSGEFEGLAPQGLHDPNARGPMWRSHAAARGRDQVMDRWVCMSAM